MTEPIFWLCFGLVAFAYLGYPPTIWLLSRVFGRKPVPPAVTDWPSVSLVIAAYNEQADIAERVRNALRLDYPADRLEIVIASDGSTDGTAAIVRGFDDPRVNLIEFSQRRGKPAVLNEVLPTASGEIIALSDANAMTSPDALKCLTRWFADPTVGTVCGRLVLTDPATGRNVDSLYWKYETFLKKCESRLGALLGSNGAIYAIRKSLIPSIPDDTIVEDFVMPLRAKLLTGCRIIYDRDAVACEQTPERIGTEFHRRARIGAGGFQAIGLLWPLLNPINGWVAFTFFAHKILRWVGPFLLVVMTAANVVLLEQPFYRGMLLGQIAFYAAAVAGAYLPTRPKPLRFLRLATMFVGMNAALMVGFFRWLTGTQRPAWQRTARAAGVA